MGRLLMLMQVGSIVTKRNLWQKENDTGSRMQRAAAHAINHLRWQMTLRDEPTHAREAAARNARAHLFARQPAGLLLSSDECSSMQTIELAAAAGPAAAALAHDCWTDWGMASVPHTVHIYTDGSFCAPPLAQPSSSWAVTIGDRWLTDNFTHLPTDEHQLDAAQVGGATLLGASIAVTSGVYPAELQAIARALAAFPLTCSLHVHSDSQASIAGIHACSAELNNRQRLRMAARPLLQLIHRQIGQRRAAGASVQLEHVRAHSQAADIHSVGNRLTDYKGQRRPRTTSVSHAVYSARAAAQPVRASPDRAV